MKFITAFAIIGITALLASANPPIQQIVPITPILPTTIQVPAYGAGYGPGASDDVLQQLLLEQRKTNQLLLQLLGGKAGIKIEDAPKPKAKLDVSGFLNACSSCHDRANASKAGDGLVLTEKGSLVALSPAEVASVYAELNSGRMPKGRRLDDTEFDNIMQAMDTIYGRKLRKAPPR